MQFLKLCLNTVMYRYYVTEEDTTKVVQKKESARCHPNHGEQIARAICR
jgi:hypothetical protein